MKTQDLKRTILYQDEAWVVTRKDKDKEREKKILCCEKKEKMWLSTFTRDNNKLYCVNNKVLWDVAQIAIK